MISYGRKPISHLISRNPFFFFLVDVGYILWPFSRNEVWYFMTFSNNAYKHKGYSMCLCYVLYLPYNFVTMIITITIIIIVQVLKTRQRLYVLSLQSRYRCVICSTKTNHLEGKYNSWGWGHHVFIMKGLCQARVITHSRHICKEEKRRTRKDEKHESRQKENVSQCYSRARLQYSI